MDVHTVSGTFLHAYVKRLQMCVDFVCLCVYLTAYISVNSNGTYSNSNFAMQIMNDRLQ